MDPDPGGLKTCGFYGSGSATGTNVEKLLIVFNVTAGYVQGRAGNVEEN
jgi:hypothetical protein